MPDPSPVLASGSPFAASEALYLLYFPAVIVCLSDKTLKHFKSLIMIDGMNYLSVDLL